MAHSPTSNTDPLDQIREALARRLEIVADTAFRDADPDAHLEQLKAASLHLMALHGELASHLPPRLNHFLESGSHVKALQMLQPEHPGEQPPSGA